MYFYIERDDKKIASIELPDEDEDFWGSIEEHWPQAYDLIDEDMIIPGYIAVDTWDERFFIGEDAELRDWILDAYGEAPREDWAKIISEGEFDAWGEGPDMSHPVQPGTLDGRRFEVEYEFKPYENIPHDADDEFWLSHVVSIRWVRE